MLRTGRILAWVSICVFGLVGLAFGDAEVNGWGDLRGIRVEGELMKLTSSLHMVRAGGADVAFTADQRVDRPTFTREGSKITCTGSFAFPYNPARPEQTPPDNGGRTRRGPQGPLGLSFRETLEDTTSDTVTIDLTATADTNLDLEGVYYFVNLPASEYAGGQALLSGGPVTTQAVPLSATVPGGGKEYLHGVGQGIRLTAPRRQMELAFTTATEVTIQKDTFIDTDVFTQDGLRLPRDPAADERIAVSFPLGKGRLARGQSVHARFTLKATGDIDKSPVKLALDPSRPGPAFDGVGGNFRLQSPADGAVIEYNLANLRVAWGRVEMPLASWQPDENVDPLQAAESGKIDPGVRAAMEMARTLAQKKMPLIASSWGVPKWALAQTPRQPGIPPSIQALRVQPEKWDKVYRAIGSYLVHMKKQYGAEADYFSFNEADLGINILVTPAEHADQIKRLGAHLASLGLKTKLLLGDACSPHPVKFIEPALNDPEAAKYIGAVSFHSWHDGTMAEFRLWGEAARRLKVPAIVGEAGTDAAAHQYRAIFTEPWFAQNEIDTNVNICAGAQVSSILHWQLTSDYSLLSGGGNQPLQPTRRFWQLKQLGLTPAGAANLPIASDKAAVSSCAFGDPARGVVALHLVNNSPTRPATLTGLPAGVKELRVYVTDAKRGMAEAGRIAVQDGTAQLTLERQSYTTLVSAP